MGDSGEFLTERVHSGIVQVQNWQFTRDCKLEFPDFRFIGSRKKITGSENLKSRSGNREMLFLLFSIHSYGFGKLLRKDV